MTESIKREIGGYLELERFSGEPYRVDAVALNSGRGCLEFLIRLRGIERIWLPDFLCGSVRDLCLREGVEVPTYRIAADFLPEYGFDLREGDWLYLVDYYGQLRAGDVETALAESDGRLVVDESHGFFRDPWKGADTLYTCRKFFGVADGAFLCTREMSAGEEDAETLAIYESLPRDESHARMGFVLGRYERPAGEFFAESKANNARFADEPAKRMSALTENLLRAIDYEGARHRRVENWKTLHAALGGANLLELDEPEGPFMYPLLLEGVDGPAARGRLAAEGVYVPTLWPNVLAERESGTVAHRYARDVLPLPVDQRYGADDMDYLVSLLRSAAASGR